MKTIGKGYLYYRENRGWYLQIGSRKSGLQVVSLGTHDKAEAEAKRETLAEAYRVKAKADQWAAKLAGLVNGNGTGYPAMPSQTVTMEPAKAEAAKVTEGMILGKVWEAYLASKRRPASSGATLESYKRVFTRLSDWAKGQGIQTLQGIAPVAETYAHYLDSLKNESTGEGFELSSGTVFKHLSFNRTLWRCLVGSPTPFDGLKSSRRDNQVSARPMTEAECLALVKGSGKDWTEFFRLSLWTGARLVDVATAKAESVVNGVWHLVPEKTKRMGLKLEIPLPKTLVARLPKTGPLFPTIAKQYARDRQGVSKGIVATMHAVGINDTPQGTVSHRSFRHTVETILGSAGVAQPVTDSILGHNPKKAIGSAASYRHVSNEEKSKALANLPKVF